MRLRRSVPFVAVLLALAAPAAARADVSEAHAASACPGATQEPAPGALRKARKATICLLNLERRAQGLRRLRSNRQLTRAARRHSRAMIERKFFDHVAPSGSTLLSRIKSAGYLRRARTYSVGENLGWGGGTLSTPLEMHRAWMRSPGHRENLLRPYYRQVGIGIVSGTPAGVAGATYTQNFGRRG